MSPDNQISQLKDLRKQIAGRQQAQASDPKMSVWVEASAGTGKTKVLSDRVLRLFLDDVHPSQILCLTYTKAAAVEMNDRIAARLAQWAVIEESHLSRDLTALLGFLPDEKIIRRARILFALTLDVPGGIKIQTIHSFCQEILKRFPLEAGIPPYFEIMDDRTAREILSNVSRELILKVERGEQTLLTEAIAFLTNHIREFKFAELMSMLAQNRAKILQTLLKYKDFQTFLTGLQIRLNLPEIQTEQQAMSEFFRNLDLDLLRRIADVLSKSCKTDQKTAAYFRSVIIQTEAEFDLKEYRNVFLTKDKIRTNLAHKEALAFMPEIADLMFELAQDVVAFEDKLQKIRLFESTRAIMTIAGDLAEGYNTFKRKNARLDYEDLIMLTRRLLENRSVADWILYKLDSSINHILIDEAQDTSPDQWAIIRALTEDFFAGDSSKDQTRTIFAVGDRKQSIYSFQGANPEEFDRMRQYFSQKARHFAKVRLDVSFRSTAAVLETVNNLFVAENAQSGVVIDNEQVQHLPYRVGEGGLVEIWPLIEQEKDGSEDVWYPPIERSVKQTSGARLAKQIAQNIKSMVDHGERLQSENRPIRYGDFMVLVQRRNAFVEDFVRECKNIGVQIAGIDKLKLLEQIAVQDLLSLGRFLLLPADDLSLAEVLKSPLFGLNDDDLFNLCYGRKASLWQSLRQNKSYDKIAIRLVTLLDKVDFVRPFELFNYVLTTLSGRRKFAERLGAEAEDALDEFINLTLSFEQEHIPDLQSFMQWIEADRIEVKRELEQSGADAVRLMTVHGSKGLQAPIVILPDTTRLANVKRESKLLWDDDNMVYFPLSADFYDDRCNTIYEKEKDKAFDEYRRLLYVALTRAEDRLYICGIKPQKGEDERSWYALCRQTLEKHGIQIENGKLNFASEQLAQPTAKEDRKNIQNTAVLPSWINQAAASETPLAKPFSPSHAEDEDDMPADSPLLEGGNYFRRGIIIHRLLQLLSGGKNEQDLRDFIEIYLRHNEPEIADSMRVQIINELMHLYNDPRFGFIFGPQSFAEVPLAGEVNGRIVSAQIDRLYVGDDKIMIVDFKTNRPAASQINDVPTQYVRQLQIYRQLVEKIYPSKPVETYILWTNTAHLMQIE